MSSSGLAEAYPAPPQPRPAGFTAPAEVAKTTEASYSARRARPIKLLLEILPYILFSLIVSVLVYAFARKAVQYDEKQAKAN